MITGLITCSASVRMTGDRDCEMLQGWRDRGDRDAMVEGSRVEGAMVEGSGVEVRRWRVHGVDGDGGGTV